MKISSTSIPGVAATTIATTVSESQTVAAAAEVDRASAAESALLKPAQQALAEMPDIDHAKVAELRDALARGEIKFDAGRLAALIQRYHGGHE
jgi:negative regulator of flagellin synthesis FlgM